MDLVDKVMEECFQTRFLELLLKKVEWGYLTFLLCLREPELPFVLVGDEAFSLKLSNVILISILFLFQRIRPSLIID